MPSPPESVQVREAETRSADVPATVAADELITVTPVTRVTLVMPCLNEEGAVGECIARARRTFEAAGLEGHVIVVDNGSTDRSIEVARAAGARVFRQMEPGYGAALRSGFELVETEYVVMADADGTYELEAIPKLLQPLLDDEADLVLGARLKGVAAESMPWLHRHVGTPILTVLVNRAAGQKLRLRDSQSGFRAFRRDQMLAVPMTSTGMEFASEMLIRCAWTRFRIREVETEYSKRIGESKLDTFRDGWRHLRQILLLSPEIFATDPGLAMTFLAFALWTAASVSTAGVGRIGSLSWLAILMAGVLSIIGPITYCTGLVMRYRAQSLGLRHAPPKREIRFLIRRFLIVGLSLVVFAFSLVILAVVNFHTGRFISYDAVRVLVSVAGSATVVGVVLTGAPLLSPFLLQAPTLVLPPARPED